jgi:hypothetical protein
MKGCRATWFKDFVDHVLPLGVGLQSSELTQQIEANMGILQFAAAATTIRENGYVKLKALDFLSK